MTLGQGHTKVIQYISPDPYILCSKFMYLRSILAHIDLTWKTKDIVVANAAEINWKHKFTQDQGDLIGIGSSV